MRLILLTSVFVLSYLNLNGQTTFNKQFHFGYPAAALTSVVATDSCYYATGIIVDSVYQYFAGNIFVKFDLEGNILLAKTLVDTTKHFETWVGDLLINPDGTLWDVGYAIDTTMKVFLVKYAANGDTILTKEFFNPLYPGENFIVSQGLQKAKNGDLVFMCGIDSYTVGSNPDIYLLRLDSNLNVIWKKQYGNHFIEVPKSLIIDEDGGIIVGANQTNEGQIWQNFFARSYIFKTDSIGEKKWEYKSPYLELQDVARGMVKSSDGGLVIATTRGYEHPVNAETSFLYWKSAYFFKLDNNQQLVWEMEFLDSITPTPSVGIEKLIAVDQGNAYVAAGHFALLRSLEPPVSGVFGWLFKITDNGELAWVRRHQFLENVGHNHRFYDLKQSFDGGFILVGETRGLLIPGVPSLQAWLLKVDSFGCLVPGCQLLDETQEAKENGTLRLYPNPASDYLNFFYRSPIASKSATFRIFDEQGRLMKQFESNQPEMTYIVPVDEWAEGVYFLQVISNDIVQPAVKFLVVH